MSDYKKLREVGSIDTGFAFPSSSFSTFGTPVVRMSDLDDGNVDVENSARVLPAATQGLDRYKISKGQFLFGLSGSLDAYGTYQDPRDAYLNQRVGRLCGVDESKNSYDYIRHILSSEIYRKHAYLYGSGVAQLNISPSQVESLEFFCPPIPEQRLIARILDTLDTQIQKTEALIAKLEKVKEGLLHDLLIRGIDERGQLRPSPEQAPELYKESPLGLIPREWELCTVGGLGSWKGGSTPSKSNPGFWPESGILWVSPKDLVGDEIDETEDKISELAAHASNLFVFPAGSVLVVFRSGILRKRLPVVRVGKKFTVNQDLKALIPSEGIAEEFVKYLLQGNADRILMKSVKAGTTVESLDYKCFSSYEVALPRKPEQNKISKIMKNMERRISSEQDLIKKLKKDKAGLMDDLLTGRVRVTPLLDQTQATTPA